jgi:AcrR family transcriptional regulator
MARQGLDRERVVAAAAAIADADGLEAVTLARVAADLGVRSPSLYNHVDGLDGLRRGIALRGLRELEAALRDAATGRAGADALFALADAYRAYALAHPGRYALMQTLTQPKDAELEAATEAVVGVVVAALRGFDLADDDAIHAVRAFRASVHGFVALETGEGFGLALDVDESFRRLIAALAAGLAEQGR